MHGSKPNRQYGYRHHCCAEAQCSSQGVVDAADRISYRVLLEKLFEASGYTFMMPRCRPLWKFHDISGFHIYFDCFPRLPLEYSDNTTFRACNFLSETLEAIEFDRARLWHDLRPLFREVRPPTRLKKVWQHLEAQQKSVPV